MALKKSMNLKQYIENNFFTNGSLKLRGRRLNTPPNIKFLEELKQATPFLDENSKPIKRMFYILHDLQSKMICPECNIKEVEPGNKWCSIKCSSNSAEIKNKKEYICLEKYNSPYVFSSKYGKQKIKETNLEKYGVENPLQNPEIEAKRVVTNIKKYGVPYASQSKEVELKKQKTNIKVYGFSHASQTEEARKNNQYFNFKNRGDIELTDDQILLCNDSIRLLEIFNKEGLSFLKEKTSVSDGFLREKLRNMGVKFPGRSSNAEREIILFLKKHYNGEILEGSRKIISPLEIDIFLPDLGICIEYNGLYWHSDNVLKDKQYHRNKTEECDKKGYRLIHIFEDEYRDKKNIVERKLLSILGLLPDKIYARKCIIQNISIEEQRYFLEQNHIQGYGPSSIAYGLYYQNNLVALINFKKMKNNCYNLNRYASSVRVVGGFSKILEHFKRNNEYTKIETFADLRWTSKDNNVYLKNGFIQDYITEPDYFYTKNYDIRESRQQYMKHKLSKKLKVYDENLTEEENMKNNGYHQIFDCGNIKYILENK